MIQEISAGLYTNQGMTYTIKTCPVCGKEFKCYTKTWIYKKSILADGHSKLIYYCSYTCWPAGGIINETKYDDAKIKKQEKASKEKNKDKYKEKDVKRSWLRYNDNTPRAAELREERSKKKREKRMQKAIEFWKENKK